VNYAALITGVSLKGAGDFAGIEELLQGAATGTPAGSPLVAARLDDESLAEGRLPTRHDLDAMSGDRPVLLHRYCGHIAVANPAALEFGGVGPDTPDPAGGSLDREGDRMPTGVLRETAVDLVSSAIRASGHRQIDADRLAAAMQGLARYGLTSIGAMAGCGGGAWADLGDQVALLAEAAARNPIRAHTMVIADSPEQLVAAVETLEHAGGRVRFLGLKAFSDGSLGGHTAAMHRPFADRPDERGTLRLEHAWGQTMSRAALDLDGTVAIHAIGDLANARVLALMEELIDAGADPAKLRVEHASVLGTDELAGFLRTGVTASVQPAFLASETEWLEKRLGPERMPAAYPFRTLHRAGVPLAGGSDCPVEPPQPLWGMAAARDRAGIVPDEGLDPADALALFTDWAASSLGEPPPLAPGSPADFVILDRDPVTATPDQLRQAAVLETWIDGHPADPPEDAPGWTV
jgi:predicted amidohydrolase YtcJ